MENIIELKDVCLNYKYIKSMNVKEYIASLVAPRKRKVKEVNALKNVSINIESGITVGIVGSNGAGKSTLLRVLGQIYTPDSGEAKILAESTALLTLGTGFKKDLSGIDNIYINGYLMGLTREQIETKLSDIISFAELEEFIEAPISTYSSGMKSRLGFSIACHIEPQLLLIDEVFSVGDRKFKQKSSNKVRELIQGDRTTIIISHSLGFLEELCDKVIWLEKGVLQAYGDAKEVIEMYKQYVDV